MEQPLRLSREEVREVDRRAMQELGLPGCVLMENAGRCAARRVLELPREGPVAVLCGGGNNGGDGYVLARHVHNAGREVRLFSTASEDRLTADTLLYRNVARRLGLEVVDLPARGAALDDALAGVDVAVDALLGTGFRADLGGGLREPLPQVIEALARCRSAGALVVALDLPSGLDCDTGEPSQPTVQADVTVTFVAEKKGFASPAARPFLGRVEVCSIGVPAAWPGGS